MHLLLDPDGAKALQRARIMAFLAALLTLVNGSPQLRVSIYTQYTENGLLKDSEADLCPIKSWREGI